MLRASLNKTFPSFLPSFLHVNFNTFKLYFSFFSSQTAKEILTESLGKLNSQPFKMADQCVELGLWPVCPPGNVHYTDDVTLARVRTQSGVLTFLVDSVLQTNASRCVENSSVLFMMSFLTKYPYCCVFDSNIIKHFLITSCRINSVKNPEFHAYRSRSASCYKIFLTDLMVWT